ncbi:fructosamine kinase family protein [Lentzea flaviverrucosa]|uniref:Fructosamine-3-kinase n=1 Tax=Lentzea flaviverrucosa TaxID=200379 RepID=A0A1H9N092_9PSEU|nr:fructosamine kinase family protein [Lentzea flaviverrucosa]RDI30717.1 fructosamine-3-kinase [Lentzea flaviverrucosa]SER29241.1 Fructosamine-3-kinase [Lentzea flaviverrucosa]
MGPRAALRTKHQSPQGTAAEAAGLRWLRVDGGPPIPSVHSASGGTLVIDEIPAGEPNLQAAVTFGRRLATLHLAGAPAFGSPPPGGPREATIGLAEMVNEPAPEWPKWFASQRIAPYARQAGIDVGEVCSRITELSGPPEPPARLHGDLWSGNVLWGADGQVWLIDPAAHGGHRESDLAMLQLFGCPFLDHVLGAYREVAPLADGWQARVPLHQLFPLLVHAVLFGGGYRSQAMAAARAALQG